MIELTAKAWEAMGEPELACVCTCSRVFTSHALQRFGPRPHIVSRRPCPDCGGHTLERTNTAAQVIVLPGREEEDRETCSSERARSGASAEARKHVRRYADSPRELAAESPLHAAAQIAAEAAKHAAAQRSAAARFRLVPAEIELSAWVRAQSDTAIHMQPRWPFRGEELCPPMSGGHFTCSNSEFLRKGHQSLVVVSLACQNIELLYDTVNREVLEIPLCDLFGGRLDFPTMSPAQRIILRVKNPTNVDLVCDVRIRGTRLWDREEELAMCTRRRAHKDG